MSANRHDDAMVEVLVDGTWWPGLLDPDYWTKDGDRWTGVVRWTSYVNGYPENRLGGFDQDDIREIAQGGEARLLR